MHSSNLQTWQMRSCRILCSSIPHEFHGRNFEVNSKSPAVTCDAKGKHFISGYLFKVILYLAASNKVCTGSAHLQV